jgi:ribosomal protein S3AE
LLILIDLERKVKLLSEENYELRERLLKKDVEIEKLKTEEPKAQENIINKILKKENCELYHEKEQLKLERDRLRHLVNEKQDKIEKLVTGTHAKISYLVASLPTSRQQVVSAMLVPSCQQV